MTSGIGVRTAPSILCMPIKGVMIDRILTSVTNAKQKKKTKSAQHKTQHLLLFFARVLGMFAK